MKIFYELTHTACDRENMRSSGVRWEIFHPGGWPGGERSFPEGAVMVDAPGEGYDAAVLGTERFVDPLQGTPIAFVCRTDFGKWRKPVELLKKISAWVAPCEETVDRWGMRGDPKAVVIEHGIDVEVFGGYTGETSDVITVGNKIPERPEKGPDVLREVSRRIPIHLYGFGNDGFPYAGPCLGFHDLAKRYRTAAVYFNPSKVTVCAVLEAMATGMPVVAMAPVGNYVKLMRDRENCILVSSPEMAVDQISYLLSHKAFAKRIGERARASVETRFHPAICAWRWKSLLRRLSSK